MPLFKSPRIKIKSKSSQLVYTQLQNASLFGPLYIANQQKSKLLSCLEADNQYDPSKQFDCKIFDGAAVAHLLPTAACKTFKKYGKNVLIPFILHEFQELMWSGIAILTTV